MSNKKRSYSTQFKTKVVLEALRENKTISELSVKYSSSRALCDISQ